MSKSFEQFNKIIHVSYKSVIETLKLIIGDLQSDKKTGSVPHIIVTASVKFSIVTSVAAFDKYYTDRFIEALIPYLKKNNPTKEIAKLLEDSGVNVYETLKLINMNKPNVRIKSLVRKHLKYYITQKENKIDLLYSCYGLKKFLENSEKLTKRKTLRRNVFNLIKRRHSIVHECDIDRNGNIKEIEIKESQTIARLINNMRILVESSESLLQKMGI